jgi:hypothetical protein
MTMKFTTAKFAAVLAHNSDAIPLKSRIKRASPTPHGVLQHEEINDEGGVGIMLDHDYCRTYSFNADDGTHVIVKADMRYANSKLVEVEMRRPSGTVVIKHVPAVEVADVRTGTSGVTGS